MLTVPTSIFMAVEVVLAFPADADVSCCLADFVLNNQLVDSFSF